MEGFINPKGLIWFGLWCPNRFFESLINITCYIERFGMKWERKISLASC